MKKLAWILVIVGGVNWGLVGLGVLLTRREWNLVDMIFGSVPILETLVYILVGVSAVMLIMGKCGCKKCEVSAPKSM